VLPTAAHLLDDGNCTGRTVFLMKGMRGLKRLSRRVPMLCSLRQPTVAGYVTDRGQDLALRGFKAGAATIGGLWDKLGSSSQMNRV